MARSLLTAMLLTPLAAPMMDALFMVSAAEFYQVRGGISNSQHYFRANTSTATHTS